jgi:TRAP-type uncharacterized transport system fused permease subunit
MFVYAPSLLLVNFSWSEFALAMASGLLGVTALAAAFTGFFRAPLGRGARLGLAAAGLLLVGNEPWSIGVGTALALFLLAANLLAGLEPRAYREMAAERLAEPAGGPSIDR